MIEHKLQKAIKDRRVTRGLYSRSGSPGLIELIGFAGLEFVIVDLEHTSTDLETVAHMAKAAALSKMSFLVRVSENDYATADRLLDIGANGVVFPHVSTRGDAINAVSATKFAPVGNRGMFRPRRAVAQGIDQQTFCSEANEETIVVALIESREGVENIEEIVTVEGVDVIDTWPNDLSQSLGVPGKTQSEPVVKALERVYQVCTQYRKPVVMSYDFDPAKTRSYIESGLRPLIELDVDESLFLESLREKLRLTEPLTTDLN